MPKSYHRPKVARCVEHVVDKGHDKGSAIPICQASLGESYRISKAERTIKRKGGKALKAFRKQQAKVKAEKIAARRERLGWNEVQQTLNGFCKTGKGGGRDNSCSGTGSNKGGLGSRADQMRKRLRKLWERAKSALKAIRKRSSGPKRVVVAKRVAEVTKPVKHPAAPSLVTQRLAVANLLQIVNGTHEGKQDGQG